MFLSYTHQLLDFYGKLIEWFLYHSFRSSHPDVFYEKSVLKICSKFTGFTEHPWVFCCKFAAYCQHLWVAASVTSNGLKATNIFLSVLD